MIPSWLRPWYKRTGGAPRPARRRAGVALRLERFEDRVVPVSFSLTPANLTDTAPSFVVTGDFRGIGTVDLAVANLGGDDVSVFLNHADGTGTFQSAVNYPAGPAPLFMAVGDVFGDGIQDLVVSNYTPGRGTVSILRGNGDGTFGAPLRLNLGDDEPTTVALADLTGDGFLDVITANYSSNPAGGSVSVLRNNGDGTFAPAQTYAGGLRPYGLAVADFFGDGFPALAVGDIATGNINVLRGNGDGTFQPYQTVATLPGASVAGLAAGNLGNGATDLVAANGAGGGVSVLLNDGSGNFANPVSYGAGTHPLAVTLADVTNSGNLDVVAADYGTLTDPGGVSVLLNSGDGSGTLQPAQNFAAGNRPTSVAVADVNGDGLNDLVVSDLGDNTASVLLQVTPGPSANPGAGAAVVRRSDHSAAPSVAGAEGRADPFTGQTASALGLHGRSGLTADVGAAQPDPSGHHDAVQDHRVGDPVLGDPLGGDVL
jgi:hypothetical protein